MAQTLLWIEALPGIEVAKLTGGVSRMLANHHITRPVLIGEIRADGQPDVVWQTRELVPGAAWSPCLEGSKHLIADRVGKKCGNFNRKLASAAPDGSHLHLRPARSGKPSGRSAPIQVGPVEA